jgi:hypothetical protein
LLGDSFTNIFSSPDLNMGRRGGFAEHLAAELAQPVDVIASPAGGANGSRRALALRREGLAGKKLVIWQIAQRDLLMNPEGWQRTPLPTSIPTAQGETEGRDHGATQITGRITGITPLPKRRDYAECLVMVRYELLEGQLPKPGEAEFFVAFWGWQDWQPTVASHYREGDVHLLDLEDLKSHANLETTCWIENVDMSVKPWWATNVTKK